MRNFDKTRIPSKKISADYSVDYAILVFKNGSKKDTDCQTLWQFFQTFNVNIIKD